MLAVAAVFSAALVGRLLTAGNYVTGDDHIWFLRTRGFAEAILDGRFSDATASKGGPATMPGGPTMWLGAIGRQLHGLAAGWGLAPDDLRTVLEWQEATVAVATSLLVALVVVLVHRWAGRGAAAIAAVVLVGEPWFTALGAVVHTDELAALFGTAGLLALAITLGIPDRRHVAHPLLAAAGAGWLLAQSPLTKVTGLGYGIGAATLVAVAMARDRTDVAEDGSSLLRRRGAQVAVASAAALVGAALTWPALVADPTTQVAALVDSTRLATGGHEQFFLGEVTDTPGWWYYPVVLPFRMTPWFLIGFVVAVPLGLITRKTRAKVAWVLWWMAPLAIALSGASKQIDRYGMFLLVPAAVLVGVALGGRLEALLRHDARGRWIAGAAAAGVVVHGLVVAPYGLLYFNPLLGGGDRADEVMLVGWGEGTEIALERIRADEGGDCDGVTVAGVRSSLLTGTAPLAGPYELFGYPCSRAPRTGETPDYVIAYVNQTQRMPELGVAMAVDGRDEVGTVELRGITVASIWRLDPDREPGDGAGGRATASNGTGTDDATDAPSPRTVASSG